MNEALDTGHGSLPLFVDTPRTDPAYAHDGEPTWSFLERVDDAGFDRVRRAMNAWFARCPPAKVRDLRGRLQSNDNIEFHSAWFELYLHELHRGLGYDVSADPVLADATTQPDFLISRGGAAFFLEATVVGDRRNAGRARRIAQVTASLNRVRSDDFRLIVEIEEEGRDSPPMGSVRRQLERWLAKLPWEDVRAEQEQGSGHEALPKRTEIVGDWSFTFFAWPRAPEVRGVDDGRAIAVYPADGGTFNHAEALRERLETKAGKYGEPEKPVIIAVRVDRLSADASDVQAALMGPSIERIDPAKPRRTVSTGAHGIGLFRHESGHWRNRHIAGVLVWDQELRPWSVTRSMPTLWLHPGAEQPLPDLPWACMRHTAGVAQYEPGRFEPALVPELPEISHFDDPAEWPGQLFAGLRT